MGTKEARVARGRKIDKELSTELRFLESLAFNGLYKNIIDFTPEFQDELAIHEEGKGRTPPSDEYFAARYFFQKWTENQELEIVTSKQDRQGSSPRTAVGFLSQFKYSPEYEIFWRFVAGMISEYKDGEEMAIFFDQIDAQPRDLLGPVHLRIIIHCLSEVQVNGKQKWRASRENDLTNFLLAEYDILGTSNLAAVKEFPEESLIEAFNRASEKQKESIVNRMRSLKKIMCLATYWGEGHGTERNKIAIRRILRASGSSWDEEDLDPDLLAAIVGLLGDEDWHVRRAALVALQGQQDLSPDTLTAIVGQLSDEDLLVRQAAVEVLQGQQDLSPNTLTAIIRRLGDEDLLVRQAAINVLQGQQDLSPDTLTAIVGQLGDEDLLVRQAAVEVLQVQRDLSPDTLTTIVGRLGDKDRRVRQAALKVLQSQQDLSPGTMTAIVGRLGDGDSDVRQAAVEVLQGQKDLRLNAIIRSGEALYHNMLKTSFSDHIHWCISKQSLRITLGSQTLQFRDDSIEVEVMVSEIQRWRHQFVTHRIRHAFRATFEELEPQLQQLSLTPITFDRESSVKTIGLFCSDTSFLTVDADLYQGKNRAPGALNISPT
ncbi:hypothetical protein N7540_012526 [Penicillium herquei]|nr:hypothetical protein N7540_012526 [Penicillium herquei]